MNFNDDIIISQGKHDISKDPITYEPIVAKNVPILITEIKLSDRNPESQFIIKMEVMKTPELHTSKESLKYAGRRLQDYITFDPLKPGSFKYRQLRAAIGNPYKPNEAAQIKLKETFLNKALMVDLDVYNNEEKNVFNKQDFKYKLLDSAKLSPVPNKKQPETDGITIKDEDLPFDTPEAARKKVADKDEW
jgi:hypothetical protein